MWLFLIACAETCPPGSTEERCLLERAPEASPAEIQAIVEQIQDPIIRSAAVEAWVVAHSAEDPATAARLCEKITGPGQEQCKRRAVSPHLQQRR